MAVITQNKQISSFYYVSRKTEIIQIAKKELVKVLKTVKQLINKNNIN